MFRADFNREAADAAARQMMAEQDARWRQQAEAMFDKKTSFVEAVARDIQPALVSIHTKHGVRGSGFYQHPLWLASNAHVMPCLEVTEGAVVRDLQGHKTAVSVEKAYHRPDQSGTPDVVIVKVENRPAENMKCLRMDFQDSWNGFHADTCFFYFDLQDSQIKMLVPCSPPGFYPVTYVHEDGTDPMPGTSGSPILEGRVLVAREPQWQFRVVGALYARCDASWYNQQVADRHRVAPEQKLVCAVPVIQEFHRISDIIRAKESAERCGQMATVASTFFHDAQGVRDAARYAYAQKLSEALAAQGLKQFEAGATTLDIGLPDGLEKLYCKGIIKISQSLMIAKVLKKLAKKDFKKFQHVSSLTLDDLDSDYQAFLSALKNEQELVLKKGNECYFSPEGYFRLDVDPVTESKKQFWKIELQDNTGKKTPKLHGKSVSSIFAIVKIPRELAVDGPQMAGLIKASQDALQPKKLSDLKVAPSVKP